MLDSGNRLSMGKDLTDEVKLKLPPKVYIYYEHENRRLVLKSEKCFENQYYVKEQIIDEKSRVVIPASVRNAFPNATYLPVTMNGEIYILII